MSQLTERLTVTSPGPNPTGSLRPATRLAKPYHFGTIPAKAGAMFKAVRETMVETYTENDVLDDFREQFMELLHETQLEKMPAIPGKGSLDITKILESQFAFA